MTITGKRVLVTGVTGQVAGPVALALAADNDVWGLARFKDPGARSPGLEASGVRCVAVNLLDPDLAEVPEDIDYVLNFAVAKTGRFDRDLAINAEALGLLMSHCRRAAALLHCSSTAVYQPDGHHRFGETDPLGDHHRDLFPTYSISKIAAESMAGFVAREWRIPTTIARLNVPYGATGGWPAFHLELILAGRPVPVRPDGPSLYNPIHSDDIIGQIPALLAAASVPATVVNWAGAETVSIEDWCGHLGRLTGRTPSFEASAHALQSVAVDTARLERLAGAATVGWRDGFVRMVTSLHPEALRI